MAGTPTPPQAIAAERSRRGSGGCGYLVMVVITASVLLLINGALINMLFSWYAGQSEQQSPDLRPRQIFMVVGPIAMILAEYWVYDLIVDRLAAVRHDRRVSGKHH